MAQFPQDRAAGSAPSGAAPAALTLADILQALSLGARMTLRVNPAGSGSDVIVLDDSSSQTVPLSTSSDGAPSPAHPGASTATTGDLPVGSTPANVPPPPLNVMSVSASAASAGTPREGTSSLCNSEETSRAAEKAKAEPGNGPCADCAARGCLPPPSQETEEPNGQVNQPMDGPSVRWYSVTVGRQVGVFAHWLNVAPLVVGVSGAVYVKYSTRASAQAAFTSALDAGAVHVIE